MKKVLKLGGIILVVLIVLGVIFGDDDASTPSNDTAQTATADTGSAETPAPEEVMNVELASFVAEFDENQLAAESKYEKKMVEITGFIDNISEDITGSYYLILKPSAQEHYYGTSVQCYFKNKEELVSLRKGESVTVTGRVDTQMMNVLVKECAVKI